MSRARSGSRLARALGGLVVVAATTLGAAASGPVVDAAVAVASGDAQPGTTDGILVVSSVTPWVAADGEFVVAFEPTTEVPLDAVMRVTVGQRLTGSEAGLRDATDSAIAEGGVERVLQATRDIGVLELGNPAEGMELQLGIRSSSSASDRVFIPNPGVHPVLLELADADGSLLWSSTVYLNRLPEDAPLDRDGNPASSAVRLVASLESSPALAADGTVALSAEERSAASSSQSLLVEARDLPLTVALRPNTLLGFDRGGDDIERAFLEVARDAAWEVAAQSYVRVDAAGLVASGTAELQRQTLVGMALLIELTGAEISPVWVLDDTVDTPAAQVLAALGIRDVVTSDVRIDMPDSVDRATGRSRTFALEDASDMTVSTYDAGMTRAIVEPDIDPAMRAHHALTLAMAVWFDALSDAPQVFPGVTSIVLVPPGTDLEVLEEMVRPLSGEGPLRLDAPLAATHDGDGPLAARLRRSEPPEWSGVLRRTGEVRTQILGYRSIAGSADEDARLWDLVNDQTPSSVIDDGARGVLWSGIGQELDGRLALIEGPPSRTIVLTSRAGTIPLRFRNGLGQPVRLRMTTRSPRLSFPGGDTREIVLGPGENRIDVPVAVQASGSSLLRIRLESPDGSLDVRDATVTVRSSSISGVGAALSILSLLVLGGWWWRTHRRRSTTGDHPPEPSDEGGTAVGSTNPDGDG